MSMSLNDDELFVDSEITLEDQIVSLTLELENAKAEIKRLYEQNVLNIGALKLLIKKCQEGGFNAFPDIPLTKFMTKEELITRNKQVRTNRVHSEEADAIKFPTHEELLERYKPSEKSAKIVETILGLPKAK